MAFYEQMSGFLMGYMPWTVVAAVVLAFALSFFAAPFFVWAVLGLVALAGFSAPLWLTLTWLAVSIIFVVKPLRRTLVSAPVLKMFKGIMPKISDTERTALEAGVVWSEADLFSGKPDLEKLMNEPYPGFTPEEQAFLDGPVEELCAICDEWRIWKERKIDDKIYEHVNKHKFLGMIIPKEYGGLGFSNMLHSEVIQRISSRSIAAAITVMVPNSLGPAELLIHYGTEEQKKSWLPRLASGAEMPCFGLTEPQAGSDAGSISSEGILFKGDDGKIHMRLTWRKRWITLASISTVIGLAFKLRDPENLLGKGEDLGITCALIPSKTPGVVLGRQHDPLGVPFSNCPTEGHNVVVNAEDAIIGGLDMAGKGWRMLMESLAAGRGISLPAQSNGICKMATRAVSAHCVIRKQFGVSIGKFEGVEEPLARMAGKTYLLEAMRRYTISPLDQGLKPPVVTAITKFCATEIGREIGTDAMDIMGGAGISMGPRNLLAIPHCAAPVAITVEGANILTRTLMIFGQGALRCHPYAFNEFDAVGTGDVRKFDENFWGHVGHIGRNKARMFAFNITRGHLAGRGYGKGVGRYFQKLAWASATFAFMSDMAMGMLGGSLKFREKLTGRYADVFSWLYIGTAVLRRYKADGYKKEDLPFVHFSMQLAFHNIQKAMDGIYANFDVPVIGWVFKGPVRWWASLNTFGEEPLDKLTHEVAKLVMVDGEVRDRLTEGAYIPTDRNEQLGRLDHAFRVILKAQDSARKIKKAVRKKELPKKRIPALIDMALEKNIITADEATDLKQAEELRWDAIQVDDFTEQEFIDSSWPENRKSWTFLDHNWGKAKGNGNGSTPTPMDSAQPAQKKH